MPKKLTPNLQPVEPDRWFPPDAHQLAPRIIENPPATSIAQALANAEKQVKATR